MKSVFNIATAALLCAVACRPARPAIPSPAADGGDAQRLVALVDYVAGDYGGAVKDGVVVSESEYDEQRRFAADAKAMAHSLLGSGSAEDRRVVELVDAAEAQVAARAPAAAVRDACRAAREAAVARFGLRTAPAERPSLPRAQALYAENCAVCHGARGDANTERGRALDPHPASFRDPGRLGELSPFRVYNALTFGVRGTAMASFDSLSPAERWDLAFYVFRLGHEGEPEQGPAALSLAEMATHTDRELLAMLEQDPLGLRKDHSDRLGPQAALAHVRREAPFVEPPAAANLERTRRMVREAVAAFGGGDPVRGDRLVIDAYLEGFEPLEPRLRAQDADGTAAVEASFRDLRAAIKERDSGRVRAVATTLDSRLVQFSGERRAVPFAAAFLIYFREGIEAALLIGALLAGVRRVGRPDGARWVHFGWLAALPAGVATWWVLERLISLGADRRELMESGIAIAAAAVLFSVSFWMISKAESRQWMAYLRRNLEHSLTRKNLVLLAGLAFLAVYREAAETILFTQALLMEAGRERLEVWAGAAAGLALVSAVAFVMTRTVVRLPLGPFFGVSGVLLCGLAISFAGSGIYGLVAAGYLSPHPVTFPEVPWMGIHPDLVGLLVQLAIVLVVAAAAVATLRRAATHRDA